MNRPSKSPSNRYTEQQLIDGLRLIATDYNVRPSQKRILDDSRMANHHTYIQRFGSYPKALEIAKVDHMEDSRRNELTVHDRVKSILEYFTGLKIIGEYVPKNGLIIDFEVLLFERRLFIDIVDVSLVGDWLSDWADTHRPSTWFINSKGSQNEEYVLINSMNEARTLLEEIQRDLLEGGK